MQKIKGRFKKDVSFKIITTKVEYHKDFRALLSHWEDGQHAAEHRKLIKRAEAKQKSYEDQLAFLSSTRQSQAYRPCSLCGFSHQEVCRRSQNPVDQSQT